MPESDVPAEPMPESDVPELLPPPQAVEPIPQPSPPQPSPPPELPDESGPYEIRDGDTLSAIAGEVYGDPARWLTIYDANRGRIRDPDLIFPDQELVIPRAEAPTPPREAVRHQVTGGDHLWKIAAVVYGDPRLWPLIYDANRDRVSNPDLIYPWQRLVIPRDLTPEDQRRKLRQLWADLR